MYNDIITIGKVTIQGYGFMIAIGVTAALLVGDYRAKKKGLNGDLIYGLTYTTVFLGFLAAKILFIITEWEGFIKNPKAYLNMNGFVVFGGIIGGLVTIWAYCKIKKMDFGAYLDLMVPSVALAQGFGRIGCFLAGCCYGKETDSWWGIVFTNSKHGPNNVRLLPSQLFMSAGDFALAAILIFYARRERIKGKTSALYLMLYSIGRFLVEFTRNDDRGFVGALSTSQFIGIFIFIAGVAMFFGVLPVQEKRAKEKRNMETRVSTEV